MDDPRRTQSNFERAGILFSYYDNLLSKTCYLMIILDPKSYYHARNDPRWQVSMDEEMNPSSLQKFQHAFAFLFFSFSSTYMPFLYSIGVCTPNHYHECGINIFDVF